MLRRLKSPIETRRNAAAWRTVLVAASHTGLWAYQENSITGGQRTIRLGVMRQLWEGL